MRAVLRKVLEKLFEFLLQGWFKNDMESAVAFLIVVFYLAILGNYSIQIGEYLFRRDRTEVGLFLQKLLLSSEAAGMLVIQFAVSYYFQGWVMTAVSGINIAFAGLCFFYVFPTKKKKLTEKR